MAEYVPDSAAAFLEINSLSTVFSEIVKTDTWKKLAPNFGISKQIEYLTSAADILTFTGLAPAEASLLAVAQYALVLDNLELATEKTLEKEEENELEITPRFALVIETHSRSSKVEEYLANRVDLLAKRIYSNKLVTQEEVFNDIKIKIFQSQDQNRSLISAQKGSVLIIGNSLKMVQNCLSVLLGKQPSFKNNPNLKLAREKIGSNSIAFGFIKKETLSKTLQIGTAFLPNLAAISNSENQTIPSIISSQLIEGLAYSASFKGGKVVEQYFTLIKPEVMEKINLVIKPNTKALNLTPKLLNTSLDFTVLLVDKPTAFLDEIVNIVSSRTDAVISFALRQLVIELGKKYGILPSDPIGNLIGNEVALVKLKGEEKDEFIIMLPVTNKLKMLPSVGRYLRKGAETLKSEDYKGVEIVSNPDVESRAIAFLDDYLILGTQKELIKFIDLWQQAKQNSYNRLDIIKNSSNAIFLSSKIEKSLVGDFFLGLSRLLRTTDGAKDILNNDTIKPLIENLPPTIGLGKLTSEGLMIEKESTLGIFVYLSMLFDNQANELQEKQTSKTEKTEE
ncbi:MAG: DUF3352 domain-containing protein [Acidobacteria bacterium]|nr:DUF3352 domain-containing protein [Acidobacteriota bacterium]